ncbi:RNA-directed DNA polymerase, eukaryota [Tanacetum coccineum]|uniref:RNA-directed DNA polymerase, eukaryota n=1 Tax=Tanacetum coccineum TaxID=301880 RepID=A0ABQ5I7S2_9ASTR
MDGKFSPTCKQGNNKGSFASILKEGSLNLLLPLSQSTLVLDDLSLKEHDFACRPSHPPGFTPNDEDSGTVKDPLNDQVKSIPTKNRFTLHNGDTSSQRSTSMLISGVSSSRIGTLEIKEEEMKRFLIFPEHIRARDLWNVCNEYGLVVDAYIPSKRSKAGKRFAFIRFIKVFNLECLTENLYTIWMGSFRLHANKVITEERDFSMSLMGKVKEVSAIPNLNIILSKEGFQTVKLTYLRGLWVLIELGSLDAMEKFVSLEGLPIIAWTTNKFSKVASKWGDLVVWEESEENSLAYKHLFHWISAKELDAWVPKYLNEDYSSDDESSELDEGCPSHPPGFTPNDEDSGTVKDPLNDQVNSIPTKNRFTLHNGDTSSQRSTSMLISGGSILEVMDDLVKVGQTMGYNMGEDIHTLGLTNWPPRLWVYYVRMFYSWFKMEGFDKFMEDPYHSIVIEDSNGLSRMKKKLQLLKSDIKTWIKENKKKINEAKKSIQSKLTEVDKSIDQGGGNEEILNQRALLMKDLNDINYIDASELSQKAKFPQGCNSPFIDLIPKIHDAKDVKDFWPISLIGSLYKIIAKFLANRLSLVMSDLISDVQTTFISKCQILDGPFILNELLSWCKHKKINAMIFKVDFEKAFDFVRWDYLDDVINSFEFGDKWRNWIFCCLDSAMGSVLINGSPTAKFQFHKGLKQGDPLSPFLFILVMESLHISFTKVLDAGLYKGISINNSLMISHLFYADDAIFVGKWDINNIKTIVNFLKCFFMASGLKINLHKSKLARIGVSKENIDLAANIMGCSTFSPPFNYLGIKV